MSKLHLNLGALLLSCALLVLGPVALTRWNVETLERWDGRTLGTVSTEAANVQTFKRSNVQTGGAGGAGGTGTPLPDVLRDMPEMMKAEHGRYDNLLTAMYEQWLNGGRERNGGGGTSLESGPFAPHYGPDVRMSNPGFSGNQVDFQIDINPLESRYAVGGSTDGPLRVAGVGIYRTTDGGQTWVAGDAPIGTSACCEPAVAYAYHGTAHASGLDINPPRAWTINSTDNGATWSAPVFVALADRPTLVVDNGSASPRRGAIYITYSDLPTDTTSGTSRIKGYRSTDGGQSWGTSFFVGGALRSGGYQQASQPRVASDGTLYVGYQDYTLANQGCAAAPDSVMNMLARSTDGGASFTQSIITGAAIKQGGACLAEQAGRGVFCINNNGESFRSRSHPILGVHPTNPTIVYAIYSGGDLESPYTCAGAGGFHSDIIFAKSTNRGATWGPKVKINTDGQGFDQYHPWMDVAPNGTIWVGWNDRREDPDNFRSRWYQAFSTNEGATWNESPVGDMQTQPSTFIGDYHGLAAENDRVLGMWYDSRDNASGDPYTDPDAPHGSTPTRTVTGTPPTATRTRTPFPTLTRTITPTRTTTPTPTSTLCANYSCDLSTGSIVPGTTDIGNHCADLFGCVTTINLPFPFTLYDRAFTSANVLSHGSIQFLSANDGFSNFCFPLFTFNYAILPFWDTLITSCPGCGIFTSVSGSSPNRIFNVEWRANNRYGSGPANFEVRMYEGLPSRLEFIYGQIYSGGGDATIGLQRDTGTNNAFTRCGCDESVISPGSKISFTLPACATATPTVTGTPPTATPTCVTGNSFPAPWQQSGTDPDVRVRAGHATDGQFVYIWGGEFYTFRDDFWRWNSATGQWTRLANIPSAKSNVQGAYWDGKIYSIGGFDFDHLVENAIYDIATDSWSFGAPQPVQRSGATAAYEGKIYVFGGNPGPSSQTLIYDIASDSWSVGADMPEALTYGRAITVGDFMYYVGGIPAGGGGFGASNANFRYDPNTNSWAVLAPLNTPRSSEVLMSNGTEIYAVNGGGQSPFRALPQAETVEIYNIAGNVWRYGPPVLQPLSASAGGLAGRKLMIQGGVDHISYYQDVQVSELGGPCSSPANTPTSTPTPTPVLVGHVIWQGRPPQPDVLQQLPVTLALRSGATVVNFPNQATDPAGFFTVPLGGLAAGTYNWWAKGQQFLANAGTVALERLNVETLERSGSSNVQTFQRSNVPTVSVEMGTMRSGDASNDNIVGVDDFNILRNSFGLRSGMPGFDERADFTGDDLVDVSDFVLLKLNFGQSGPPPLAPYEENQAVLRP